MAGHLEALHDEVSDRRSGLLRKALHYGLQLRIWVALCVSSLADFADRTMAAAGADRSDHATVLAVIFLSTLALYNLDGSIDASGPLRHSKTRQCAHRILTAISCVGLLFLVPQLPPKAALLTGVGLIGCSFYALPSPLRGAEQGLKFLPGLKAPFVGVAVSSAVVGVPALARTDVANAPSVFILWLTLCAYCTANALLFDIPDLKEDRQSRVPTVARKRGVASAQRLSSTLASLGLLVWPVGILGYFGFRELVSRSNELLPLSTLGVFLLFCSRRIHEDTNRSQVAWFVDGGLLLPALLVAVDAGFR